VNEGALAHWGAPAPNKIWIKFIKIFNTYLNFNNSNVDKTNEQKVNTV